MSDVDLTISARRPEEPSSLRLVATLALAGLLSGLALAGVHELTKPTIAANKKRALRNAVLEVVPGATDLRRLVRRDDTLVASVEAAPGDEVVFAAFDADGRFLGYAIEGAGAGFQDTIRVLFGYDPARKQVIGLEVLESRETPGLGDKIYKDAAFVDNFAALAVEPGIVLVKGGRTAAHEVDAITGATISSRAVVNIVRRAGERWRPALPPTPPAAEAGPGPGASPGASPGAGPGGGSGR